MGADEDLLNAWRAGDERAGSKLLTRHFDSLYRFFHNKVGPDAEDIIQQTLISAVKNRDRFRGDCSFRTYLLRIARSRLYDFLRSKARNRVTTDLGVSSIVDLGLRLSQVAAKNQEQAIMIECMRELAVEQQIALELHYWEGMTAKEIGEVLEVPLGTVKTRLRRAKQLLREKVEARTRIPQDSENLDASLRLAGSQMHVPADVPNGLESD